MSRKYAHIVAELLGLASVSTRAYTAAMRGVLSCLFLFVLSLSGQSVREDEATRVTLSKLNSTLMALKDAGASQASLSQQLVDEMMSLAENEHRPSRPVVTNFADELTRELTGRGLNSAQITAMRQCIVEVMRRTGTSNLELASRLQETLAGIGIGSSKTQLIVRNFIAVREAVRGPDDSPLRQPGR